MIKAVDKLKEHYLTEEELAQFLGVDTKRIRDLRSCHVNGKIKFIDHIKPTSKCILYDVNNVIDYLNECNPCSFGIAKEEN